MHFLSTFILNIEFLQYFRSKFGPPSCIDALFTILLVQLRTAIVHRRTHQKHPAQTPKIMPPKKKVPINNAAPLVAQGASTKRTPTSAFDGAAGKDLSKDVYEPE